MKKTFVMLALVFAPLCLGQGSTDSDTPPPPKGEKGERPPKGKRPPRGERPAKGERPDKGDCPTTCE